MIYALLLECRGKCIAGRKFLFWKMSGQNNVASEPFKACLESSGEGSEILVTTRKE